MRSLATMRHAAAALIAAAVLLLALAPAALGTDAIYWANYSGEDSWGEISVGDLDGNGADFSTPGATVNGPVGVAVDPAAGQIYWANSDADKISSASIYHPGGAHDLVTTGATVSTPQGVAVDPAAGRVYWANTRGNKISFARLDGSGGGDLPTGAATVNAPVGVALDPSRERIYWANSGANRISFARLDGSDGGDLVTTGATVDGPAGVAIDSSEGGRIYWANRNADRISFADLNGTGGGDLATTGATVDGPVGVGLDLSAGRIYWGNFDGNKLSFAKLDGSGGDDLEVRGATLSGPNFPVAVSWASSSTLAVGRPKLNRKRGTATLPVRAPARGTLRLNGMGLVPRRLQSRRGGERLTLSVVAKGKAKRRLARKGTLKVRARLVFTSTAGIAQVRTKRITLKKARRSSPTC